MFGRSTNHFLPLLCWNVESENSATNPAVILPLRACFHVPKKSLWHWRWWGRAPNASPPRWCVFVLMHPYRIHRIGIYEYIPRTQLTSIFQGQPSKTRPFSIKTRVILVLGIIYIYIYRYIYPKNQPNVGKHTIHGSYGECDYLVVVAGLWCFHTKKSTSYSFPKWLTTVAISSRCIKQQLQMISSSWFQPMRKTMRKPNWIISDL